MPFEKNRPAPPAPPKSQHQNKRQNSEGNPRAAPPPPKLQNTARLLTTNPGATGYAQPPHPHEGQWHTEAWPKWNPTGPAAAIGVAPCPGIWSRGAASMPRYSFEMFSAGPQSPTRTPKMPWDIFPLRIRKGQKFIWKAGGATLGASKPSISGAAGKTHSKPGFLCK